MSYGARSYEIRDSKDFSSLSDFLLQLRDPEIHPQGYFLRLFMKTLWIFYSFDQISASFESPNISKMLS